MIARRFASLGLLSVLLGCGISQPRGGPAPAPKSVVLAAGGVGVVSKEKQSSERAAGAPSATLRLTRALAPSPPLPTPRIELQRPTLGEVIEAPLARRYDVRLQIGAFVLTEDGQGAMISLDGRRPRRWPSEGSLSLGELLPENEEIAAGPHSLFVVLVDQEGRVLRGKASGGPAPFFLVDFAVGRPATLPDSPRLFCLSPTGTYYGQAGQSARLELFPVGPFESTVRLRVEGPGMDAWAEADPELPYSIAGLPFGDVRITVFRGESPVARCVTTINPEKSR